MYISIDMAASYLDVNKRDLFVNPKYRKHLILRKLKDTMFDIDSYNEIINKKLETLDYCIDMVNFAEFVISKIGDDDFKKAIPTLKRQGIIRGLENSKFSLSNAQLIEQTFKKYLNSYKKWNENTNKNDYIPIEKRVPLEAEFIKEHYWKQQKTSNEIAKELNVPTSCVLDEIKRLGLGKKQNGIKHRGKKGFKMTEEQKAKRENQPHAKPIVQICPETFEIVREYKSKGAVEKFGFNRENVRRAIKSGGLHNGFLWALKGFEKPLVKVVQQRGNLEIKLRANKFKRPSKEELHKFYIVKNYTAEQCAEIFACHKTTIAILAMKYGLSKKKKPLNINELKKLYIKDNLTASEIAKIFDYKTSSIVTYLHRNNIKKLKTRN